MIDRAIKSRRNEALRRASFMTLRPRVGRAGRAGRTGLAAPAGCASACNQDLPRCFMFYVRVTIARLLLEAVLSGRNNKRLLNCGANFEIFDTRIRSILVQYMCGLPIFTRVQKSISVCATSSQNDLHSSRTPLLKFSTEKSNPYFHGSE